MLSTKNRILLLFHTLTKTDNVMVCKDLANVAKVSERTVKNDLVELKAFANESGCSLCSKKGEGYWLKVENQKKYELIKEQLDIRFSNVVDIQNTVFARSNHLARIIIAEENYIKLDEVAESMFLSRSSLKAELKEVRSFFKSFNIELDARPGKGVKAIGKEISKRLCMIELYEIHYRKKISIFENNKFTEFFDVDENERLEIRKIFLNTIRQSKHSVLDSFANRIIYYLILMRNRKKLEYHMELSEESIPILKQFHEYKLAKNIIQNLQVYQGFNIDDNEICGLELLLLIWMDLSTNDDLEMRYGTFFKQSLQLSKKIFSELNREWNVKLAHTNEDYREMTTCLLPIIMQIHFKCSQYLVTGAQVDHCTIKASPFSMVLAKSASKVIETEYECVISEHYVNMIAVCIYMLIDNITYDYTPRKLIVCSRTGKKGAQIMKDKILKRYNQKWFEKLDVYEYYEVRNYEQEGYDYVICNFDKYSYNYSIPYLWLEQVPTCDQMNRIYNEIILGGYDINSIHNKCKFEPEHFFANFDYDNKFNFINLLSYKHGLSQKDILVLQTELHTYSDSFIRNDIMMLSVNRQHTRGNCLEVYKLNKKCIWERKSIEYIVFVSIDLKQDLQIVRFIEHATSVLFSSSTVLDEVITRNSMEHLIELITLNLKAG